MNKKGILSTILVIQLVLLVLLTFSIVESEREQFSYINEYRRLASFRVADVFDNMEYDILYLESKNATNETMNEYFSFLNETFSKYSFLDFKVNRTFISLQDHSLEISKEAKIR